MADRHFLRPEGSRGSTGSRHGRGAGGGEAIPGVAPRALAGRCVRGSGAARAGRGEPAVPTFAGAAEVSPRDGAC